MASTCDEMKNQITFFLGGNQIIFGKQSVPADKLKEFMRLMETHKQAFKTKILTDPNLIASVLYAINIRYQLWLILCKKASDR